MVGMKKEDRELLLRDLCGRIPYGPMIDYNGIRTTLHDIKVFQLYDGDTIKEYTCLVDIFGDNDYVDVENIKPYLFPLSSMTEEQKTECFRGTSIELTEDNEIWSIIPDLETCTTVTSLYEWLQVLDFLNKNHFDYRGLIPKGLAIDASNLNIY